MFSIRLTLVLLFTYCEYASSQLVSHNPNDIHFYLYPDRNNQNYSQEIVFRNESTLASSNFTKGIYTVFMLHGFNNYGDPDMMQPLKDSYLNSGIIGNFIVMNWYNLTTVEPNIPDILLGYPEVVLNVPIAARRLADCVYWMVSLGYIDLEHIHFVGHSLGAHASGQAGQILQGYLPGQEVARVTGMDPAGPLFTPPTDRNVNFLDAKFVDLYHTNRGMLGEDSFGGDVDFIVNQGTFQPNCSAQDFGEFPPGKCSHGYAVLFYAYSINHNFTACLFGVWNECGRPVRAGEYTPWNTTGLYHVVAPPLLFDCAATTCPE